MIRHTLMALVFILPIFANAQERIREDWEIYEEGAVHLIGMHKQDGQLERISFEFNYESEDGLRFIATIGGHSVGKLIPLSFSKGCFYAKLYENFESTENDYIICETKEKVLLSNIDVKTPSIMPMHLIFSKKAPASE